MSMNAEGQYSSFARTGESFLAEKSSKFYGFAFHTKTKEEVLDRLTDFRVKYANSNHVCFAYRLEPKHDATIEEMASDAGEPAHSAGTPILNAIRGVEATNALVIVVRYFGGIKLGVRGLIDAYGSCAKEAISNAGVKVFIKTTLLTLTYPYELSKHVQRIVNSYQGEFFDQAFGEKVTCSLSIPDYCIMEFMAELEHLSLQPTIH